MKKFFFQVIFMVCCISAYSQQTEISPKADTLYNHLMSAARPAVKNWVSGTAAKYKGKDVTQEQVITDVKQSYNILGNLNSADVEAIAFLVMMQAAKSAQEDLKGIMGEVKKMNEAKASQRQQANTLKQPAPQIRTVAKNNYQKPDSLKPINASVFTQKTSELKNKKDDTGELSETQQLKMQMIMDRRNKMNEAISNLLKKVSETENQVIQNLK